MFPVKFVLIEILCWGKFSSNAVSCREKFEKNRRSPCLLFQKNYNVIARYYASCIFYLRQLQLDIARKDGVNCCFIVTQYVFCASRKEKKQHPNVFFPINLPLHFPGVCYILIGQLYQRALRQARTCNTRTPCKRYSLHVGLATVAI